MVGRCLIRPIGGAGFVMQVVKRLDLFAIPSEARAVVILPQPRDGVRSAHPPSRGE
jgi:hypothetical protein